MDARPTLSPNNKLFNAKSEHHADRHLEEAAKVCAGRRAYLAMLLLVLVVVVDRRLVQTQNVELSDHTGIVVGENTAPTSFQCIMSDDTRIGIVLGYVCSVPLGPPPVLAITHCPPRNWTPGSGASTPITGLVNVVKGVLLMSLMSTVWWWSC